MFKEFLKAHIQNLIECSTDTYKLTDKDIDNIADTVEGNENVWDFINEAIYQELDMFIKYEAETGNEENENE